MKICHTCQRSYDDDLSFCLDDGTPLISHISRNDANKTAVLPTTLKGAALLPTLAAPPLVYASAPATKPHARAVWTIAAISLLLLVIGLIGIGGLWAWTRGRQRNPNATALTNRQSPAPSAGHQPSVIPSPLGSPSPSDTNWLDGVWEGEGHQMDMNTPWAVRLSVRGETFSVEYPDIPCKGQWHLIDRNSGTATFTEVITDGVTRCTNNGHVTVEKRSPSEILCRYAYAGTGIVVATAVLSKND